MHEAGSGAAVPSADEGLRLHRQAAEHLWLAYARPGALADGSEPPLLVRSEGVYLWDEQGRRYLDGIGALEACVAGHSQPSLAAAAAAQMTTMPFIDVFRYVSPPAVALAARLAAITPGDLQYVHFTPGGSEAVETAIKIAKQYQQLAGRPGRYKVITRAGAYHGCTFGAMSVDGRYWSTNTSLYEPLAQFGRVAQPPYCYRCPWDLAYPSCGLRCAEHIEEVIAAEGADTVAAVIVDPVATAIGVALPPREYLARVAAICKAHDILLIDDEVIAGFGHTGRLFACEHAGVVPDIMTVSKGLSSGYLPIGATIASARVAAAFRDAPGGVLSHGQTFGGHPVACAVALRNIAVLEEQGLVERAAALGPYLQGRLETLRRHSCVGDVRSLGLLAGVELVSNRRTRALWADVPRAAGLIRRACQEEGLITLTLHPGNVLLLAPPLIITHDEIDEMVACIDRALERINNTLVGEGGC